MKPDDIYERLRGDAELYVLCLKCGEGQIFLGIAKDLWAEYTEIKEPCPACHVEHKIEFTPSDTHFTMKLEVTTSAILWAVT